MLFSLFPRADPVSGEVGAHHLRVFDKPILVSLCLYYLFGFQKL